MLGENITLSHIKYKLGITVAAALKALLIKLIIRLLPDIEDSAIQGCNPSACKDSIKSMEKVATIGCFFHAFGEPKR